MPEERRDNELVLPIGTHAFVLDTNQGRLQTNAGPQKITIAGTEKTVVYDPSSPSRFREVPPSQAIQTNKVVPKGSYAILRHPHKELMFPREGKPDELSSGMLEIGKIVNVPGPRTFALWPGQEAQIVEGHHLKTNEYLIVRVYDEDEARKNWGQGTVKFAEPIKSTPEAQLDGRTEPKPQAETPVATKNTFLEVDPSTLAIGQLLLIKGTDVSFYIPPTGVEVLKDVDGKFVRQALTLERLEYCLLADQDGNKRYVRGPEVVFPLPTETFKLNDDEERKSRAYELNEISGLHLKVIANYEDDAPNGVESTELLEAGFHVSADGKKISNQEGEELFITGKTQSIYFPRIEHAILTYGQQDKKRSRYHAVAIPVGEARYVMDRLAGPIRLERGPSMFLPDPRKEVIIQRVLSRAECGRCYPGNDRVMAYNDMLRERNSDPELSAIMSLSNVSGAAIRTGHVKTDSLRGAMYAASTVSRAMDAIDRGAQYTPPRTLVIDSKFDGAPQIGPWTGYAIQLVNKKGERHVVIGPQTVILEFDERLETLFLSSGTPKNHDKVLETAYLKTTNNVTDEFDVITGDLVPIKVKLKYLVRFDETQQSKWFNIDNYVQLLVDHFRSMISNLTRQENAPEFYLRAASMLRDWVLGAEVGGRRPLKTFEENGLMVYDLEVISVSIMDQAIAKAMRDAQISGLNAQFELSQLETKKNLVEKREVMQREIASEEFTTLEHRGAISVRTVVLEHERAQRAQELAVFREIYAQTEKSNVVEIKRQITDIEAAIEIRQWEPSKIREIHELDLRCKDLIEQARAMETRSKAVQPQLVEALTALAHTGAFEVAVRHLGSLAIVQDMTLSGVAQQIFKGTGFEHVIDNMKSLGKGKLLQPAEPAVAS